MPQALSLKASSLRAFFENPIFLAAASSLCIAQLIKTVIFLLTRQRRRGARETFEIAIWRTGGMPSSHSAVVCALTTSVALVEGVTSNLFLFSFWFAMIVLRDALGVRRAAGLQAKALNHLGRQAADKLGLDFHAVKEIQGHSPLEVVLGGLLGIFIAAGFALL
jgi:acid phosphatase family membrane protein YuiD